MAMAVTMAVMSDSASTIISLMVSPMAAGGQAIMSARREANSANTAEAAIGHRAVAPIDRLRQDMQARPSLPGRGQAAGRRAEGRRQ